MRHEALVATEHGRTPGLQAQPGAHRRSDPDGIADPGLIVGLLPQHVLPEEAEHVAPRDHSACHVGRVERLDDAFRVELDGEAARSDDQILRMVSSRVRFSAVRPASSALTFEYAV